MRWTCQFHVPCRDTDTIILHDTKQGAERVSKYPPDTHVHNSISRKATGDLTRDFTVLSRDFAVKIKSEFRVKLYHLKISAIYYRSDVSLSN